MTKDQFGKEFSRLEAVFNFGSEIEPRARAEYFDSFRHVDLSLFRRAVNAIIDGFRPGGAEKFPSIASIYNAIIDVSPENKEEAKETQAEIRQKCQRCLNLGLYLDVNGDAHFCDCDHGIAKRASWRVPTGDKRRQEQIEKIVKKMPKSKGNLQGILERNPSGFWELTEAEHELWMIEKRKQIERIKERIRRYNQRELDKRDEKVVGSIVKAVENTISEIKRIRVSADDDLPF